MLWQKRKTPLNGGTYASTSDLFLFCLFTILQGVIGSVGLQGDMGHVGPQVKKYDSWNGRTTTHAVGLTNLCIFVWTKSSVVER